MKILIVDDETLIRRALSRALLAKGHEVLEAENGIEGLKIWQQNDPDLVFLDVLMPLMKGTEVLAAIGQQRRAKVVLMSAYSDIENPEKDVDLYIRKPFENIFDMIDQGIALILQNKGGSV